MRRVLLAACLLAPLPAPATAGILVEAVLEGVPLRLELGPDRARVLAEVAGAAHLVLLDENAVWRVADAARFAADALDDGATRGAYSLERWSEGPKVAGYVTSYNVMQRGETICAEVLSSDWMTPFLVPVGEAVGLLQRVAPALRPKEGNLDCGRVPFSAYGQNGWPMLAGAREAPVWRVVRIAFDHTPDPAHLRTPGAP